MVVALSDIFIYITKANTSYILSNFVLFTFGSINLSYNMRIIFQQTHIIIIIIILGFISKLIHHFSYNTHLHLYTHSSFFSFTSFKGKLTHTYLEFSSRKGYNSKTSRSSRKKIRTILGYTDE